MISLFILKISDLEHLLYCSRVFKSDFELEVLRYANKISSEAHKEVITPPPPTSNIFTDVGYFQHNWCSVIFFAQELENTTISPTDNDPFVSCWILYLLNCINSLLYSELVLFNLFLTTNTCALPSEIFLKSAWRHSVIDYYDKARNTPYFAP